MKVRKSASGKSNINIEANERDKEIGRLQERKSEHASILWVVECRYVSASVSVIVWVCARAVGKSTFQKL